MEFSSFVTWDGGDSPLTGNVLVEYTFTLRDGSTETEFGISPMGGCSETLLNTARPVAESWVEMIRRDSVKGYVDCDCAGILSRFLKNNAWIKGR